MRILIAALVALLVIPQAGEARGGGGGGHAGGGRGSGTVGFFNSGNFGFLQPNFAPMARRGFARIPFAHPFVRHQPLRFANRPVPFRAVTRLDGRFDGRFGHRFAGQRFDGTGQQWTGWGWWPVGDWSDGGYSGYSQAAAPAAADPQVIVLAENNPAQRVTVIEPGDYSDAGCHPIPNGYRCGNR